MVNLVHDCSVEVIEGNSTTRWYIDVNNRNCFQVHPHMYERHHQHHLGVSGFAGLWLRGVAGPVSFRQRISAGTLGPLVSKQTIGDGETDTSQHQGPQTPDSTRRQDKVSQGGIPGLRQEHEIYTSQSRQGAAKKGLRASRPTPLPDVHVAPGKKQTVLPCSSLVIAR